MFHRPSFSPVSFSRISFNGASQPVVQDGRSGYWRLFFTQLQEQSEQGEIAVDVTTVDAKPVTVKSVKPVKKVRAPEKVEPTYVEPESPPFRPLPMYQREALPHDFTPSILNTQNDLTRMYVQFIKISIESKLQLDAANDEGDVELLLLVA